MVKRQYFIRLMMVLISVMLLVSCEDVIDVKLKDAAPRLVVEGRITNISDSIKVLLHLSTDYFNPGGITAVNDATVTITDSRNNTFNLTNYLNGRYAIAGFHPVSGVTYNLNITSGGITYKASTVMPDPVSIDTLIIDESPTRLNQNRLNIYFKDPQGIPNYYQLKIFINGGQVNTNSLITLYSDKYSDGKFTDIILSARRFDLLRFANNDILKVQLINIDKAMFDYYQILRDITDEENILSASTPTNPPNNISNGALGYFSAFSVSQKTITIN